jgi:hypothetical protein
MRRNIPEKTGTFYPTEVWFEADRGIVRPRDSPPAQRRGQHGRVQIGIAQPVGGGSIGCGASYLSTAHRAARHEFGAVHDMSSLGLKLTELTVLSNLAVLRSWDQSISCVLESIPLTDLPL